MPRVEVDYDQLGAAGGVFRVVIALGLLVVGLSRLFVVHGVHLIGRTGGLLWTVIGPAVRREGLRCSAVVLRALGGEVEGSHLCFFTVVVVDVVISVCGEFFCLASAVSGRMSYGREGDVLSVLFLPRVLLIIVLRDGVATRARDLD